MIALILALALLFPACPTEDSTYCYWDGSPNDVLNLSDGVYVTLPTQN